MRRLLNTLYFTSYGVFMLQPAAATVFVEIPDTGNTMATATVLPGGTTEVLGTLDVPGDYDLFRFTLGTDFTLQLDLNGDFDENLLLFNSLGQGLVGDDDGGSGLESQIVIPLLAGDYFIGIGPNNTAAFTDGGVEFIDNDFGILAMPTTETLGFVAGEGSPHNLTDSPYTLMFNVAVIPEPNTLVYLLLGLGLIFVWHRRTSKYS